MEATKLLLSKFIMDNLFRCIISTPKSYNIYGEKSGPGGELEIQRKGRIAAAAVTAAEEAAESAAESAAAEEGGGGGTTVLRVMSTMQHSVSINLEILSDTLRHMASSLPYNKTARWLHGMDSHIRASKAESLNWAISMVRLGSQEDLSKHLVDDMYHAHINIPTTLSTIGLSRIQYLRYCFLTKPEAIVSSEADIMHMLLFAPQGMGLLSRDEDIQATQNFPIECEMSDYRNETGTGRIEKVSINMFLQTRWLTKKSMNKFLQWQKMSLKSMNDGGSGDGSGRNGGSGGSRAGSKAKSKQVQMRNKSWGDLSSKKNDVGFKNNEKGGGGRGSQGGGGRGEDGIQDLYLDTVANVPLPQFLAGQDALVIDASQEMMGQGLYQGDSGNNSSSGKIALREVIRSMHALSEKPLMALNEILIYIRKQQNLPLSQRDWDKAKRYELAHEYLTVGDVSGSGSGGGGSNGGGGGGRGSLLQDSNEFINIMCEFLVSGNVLFFFLSNLVCFVRFFIVLTSFIFLFINFDTCLFFFFFLFLSLDLRKI